MASGSGWWDDMEIVETGEFRSLRPAQRARRSGRVTRYSLYRVRRRYKKAHWYYRGGIGSPPGRIRRRWRVAKVEIREFGQTVASHRRSAFLALALMVAGGTLILFGVDSSGPPSTRLGTR